MIAASVRRWLCAASLALSLDLVTACRADPVPPRALASFHLDTLFAPAEGLSLAKLGLYSDFAHKTLASDLLEFEPAFPLWSDGAHKRRWLRLPEGERIDSSDADHFEFPVGTLAFKEFSRDGVRVETRVIARTGRGPEDFFMGAFVWNGDESDARFVPEGERNVRGTEHDVPSAKECWSCHTGEPGRILGFSAVQQAEIPGELLSVPLTRAFRPPGDARARAALGYLHANCGHCHNPRGSARPDTDLALRLSVNDNSLERTGAYRTGVARPLDSFSNPAFDVRVLAGRPEKSALLFRLSDRSVEAQMPPLGSERVDETGAALIRAWIAAL